MRTLELYPGERYQSAYDLADDLEWFLRESGLRSGPVRIARYLDELIIAAGGQRRPELISAAEYAHAEDGLGERGELLAMGMRSEAPMDMAFDSGGAAWDEYDEAESNVAAALGVDMESLQRANATVPVVVRSSDRPASAPPEDLPEDLPEHLDNEPPAHLDEHLPDETPEQLKDRDNNDPDHDDGQAVDADRATQPIDIDIVKPPSAYMEETDDRELVD